MRTELKKEYLYSFLELINKALTKFLIKTLAK